MAERTEVDVLWDLALFAVLIQKKSNTGPIRDDPNFVLDNIGRIVDRSNELIVPIDREQTFDRTYELKGSYYYYVG